MWGFVSQLVTRAFWGPEETGLTVEEAGEVGIEEPIVPEPEQTGIDWDIAEGDSAELVEAKVAMLIESDRPFAPPRTTFDAAIRMLDSAPETKEFDQVRADLYVIAALCCQRLAMRKASEGMKSSKVATANQDVDDPDVDDWLAFAAESLQLAHALTPTDCVHDQLFLLSTLHAAPVTDRAAAMYQAFSPAAKRGDARKAVASAKPIVESLTLIMGHQFKIRADAWRAQSRAFFMEAVHATTPVEELFNLEKAVEACVSLAEMRRARGTDLLLLLKAVKRVELLIGAPYVDVSLLHTMLSPLTNTAFDVYDGCDVFEATGTGPVHRDGEGQGDASSELPPPAGSHSSNNSHQHNIDNRILSHDHHHHTHRHHSPHHNDHVNAHDPPDEPLVSNDANDDINLRASPDLHIPTNNAHVDVAAVLKTVNTGKTGNNLTTINAVNIVSGKPAKSFNHFHASVSARSIWEWLRSCGRRSGIDTVGARGKASTPRLLRRKTRSVHTPRPMSSSSHRR